MPTGVLEVTRKVMQEPIHILVKKEELTLAGVEQFYSILQQCRTRGVEVGHIVRPVRDANNHSSHLPQYQEEGRLADREDELKGLTNLWLEELMCSRVPWSSTMTFLQRELYSQSWSWWPFWQRCGYKL